MLIGRAGGSPKRPFSFPCIALASWQGSACLAHQPLHFASGGDRWEGKAPPLPSLHTLMAFAVCLVESLVRVRV
jgi:hypothetical protein